MKKTSLITALLFVLITFQSCSVIGGIFKAGMGFGIFIVVLIIATIIFLIVKFGKSK